MLLQAFDFEVQHIAGKTNVLPDFLSRYPDDANVAMDPLEEKEIAVIDADVPLLGRVKAAQRSDPEIKKWMQEIQDGRRESVPHSYSIKEGYLVQEKRDGVTVLVVPQTKVNDVIQHYHSDPLAGHPGGDETTRQITTQYTWPHLL